LGTISITFSAVIVGGGGGGGGVSSSDGETGLQDTDVLSRRGSPSPPGRRRCASH